MSVWAEWNEDRDCRGEAGSVGEVGDKWCAGLQILEGREYFESSFIFS